MAKSGRVGTFSLGDRSGQDRQSRDHDWQPLLRLRCGRRLELRRRIALDWATSTSSSSKWTRLSASLQFHPSEINCPSTFRCDDNVHGHWNCEPIAFCVE